MERSKYYQRDKLDSVTGLLNASGFTGAVEELRAEQPGGEYLFLYLMIPNFKLLNFGYGYASGNAFLQELASSLEQEFPDDVIARESSHHFFLLSTGRPLDGILEALERIQTKIFRMKGGERLKLYAGIKGGRFGESEFFRNVDCARNACAYAVRGGKQPFALYDDEVQKHIDFELYLLSAFEGAMQRGDIQPFYQPEIRVMTEQCCGYEALARWVDAEHGLISPAAFVPLFEREQLIHRLDMHILRMVCEDMRHEMDSGQRVVPVSVNLSRLDFQLMDVYEEIERIRREYSIPRENLNLEVTESAVSEGGEYIIPVLDQLRQVGYRVWIDDFGSGYSSLNNLKNMNADVLKIDMGFVRDMHDNPKARVIVAQVIDLAKRMGLGTITEGVETREQFEFLKECGCEKVQGYLFGRPQQAQHGSELTAATPMLAQTDELCPRESRQEARYYSSLSRLNVLSSAPMDEQIYSTDNDLATAILEITDAHELRILYTNAAYRAFLKACSIESVEAAAARGNEQDILENQQLYEMARRAEEYGKLQADMLVNGTLFKTDFMFIDRYGSRAAFLAITRTLTTASGDLQAETMRLAQEYVFTEYFRVDMFDQDGTVLNIYLDADQERITEYERNSVRAVRIYAESYIRADEVEQFKALYNMETVLERLALSGERHLTKIFHSSDALNTDKLQAYTITPIRLGEHWKFLSTCRYLPPKEKA